MCSVQLVLKIAIVNYIMSFLLWVSLSLYSPLLVWYSHLVVCANVDHHGQTPLGPDASAGRVQAQLAHRDPHAKYTQVPQAQDTLSVCDYYCLHTHTHMHTHTHTHTQGREGIKTHKLPQWQKTINMN